ncbi:TIGR02281 family clan AA aspartic protease [uncultured Hydrogenophaga sp.]|uniref:retropepsin-like aspartic protease family protein n=1 Tax=uncultured Hydrogenophaga sp. TaxID=199683 RepID=UPI00265F63E3|nr:TIGR02281 family clan AA aspartic protease [uncultured Hydrogenophaga sp.]
MRRPALPTVLLTAVVGMGMWTGAAAQQVSIGGVSGSRALLIVDGGAPRFVAAGQTHQGVKLLRVEGDTATVEIDGRRQTLRVGEAPVSLGGGAVPQGSGRVVMTADSRGHFSPAGQINGRTVQFLVDTGATEVILSEVEARRINLDFAKGQRVTVSTANGQVNGHRIQLDSVRVGEAQIYGVSAIVLPQPMPAVLLGNTFLNRFQMQRTNDQLTLERRY